MAQNRTFQTHPARRAVLAASIALVGVAAAARAESPPAPPLVDMKVIDRETGETARVWRSGGRLFVAGRPGARYSLQVTNNTGGRVLAVMSVDGVNILSGQTAAYHQGGYVLSPYETYEIKGWRKSDNEIAAFNFTAQEGSYAARTGRPSEVGVIGLAAFRERTYAPPPPISPAVRREERGREMAPELAAPPPLPIPPVERRVEQSAPPVITQAPPAPAPPRPSAGSSSMARPQAEVARAAPKLGTGHGEREWSATYRVAFERETVMPQYIYRLEYDSRERLIAAGVIPRPRPTPRTPQPFPGNGYVPDPPRGG